MIEAWTEKYWNGIVTEGKDGWTGSRGVVKQTDGLRAFVIDGKVLGRNCDRLTCFGTGLDFAC